MDFIIKPNLYCGKIKYGIGCASEIDGVSYKMKYVCKKCPKITIMHKRRLIWNGINDDKIRAKVKHVMILKWMRIVREEILKYDSEIVTVKKTLNFLKMQTDRKLMDRCNSYLLDVCEDQGLNTSDPIFEARKKFNLKIKELKNRRCLMESMIIYIHNYK